MKGRAHSFLLEMSMQTLSSDGMSYLYIDGEEMPSLDNDVAINY